MWTLAHLSRSGYDCLLLESAALGSGQTIASQGIIHGGIKYALTGAAGAASRAIAEMPEIWSASLRGENQIDLTSARLLSERQYLWTTTGIASRLGGVAASKAIRTPVERIPDSDRPGPFRNAPRGVDLYTVSEPVLDPSSIISALASPLADRMLLVNPASGTTASFIPPPIDTEPSRAEILLEKSGDRPERIHIEASRIILAAGAGNADLIRAAGQQTTPPIKMQLRPLHMVMVRKPGLPHLFGHCVALSDKPRITITSQTDSSGRTVWYIGGAIAEDGVTCDRESQIAAARAEVAKCVPWVDLNDTEWATLRVDRAEGFMPDGSRPDEPVIHTHGAFIFVWPTKLAFAPLVARRITELLKTGGPTPSPDRAAHAGTFADWPRPRLAPLPWENPEAQWS